MSDSQLELLRKTAALARLELSEEEARTLAGEVEAILDHFRILASLDLEGVEPTSGATPLEDVKRPDEPRPSLPVDRTLENAPDRREDFFGVPKTIGGVE